MNDQDNHNSKSKVAQAADELRKATNNLRNSDASDSSSEKSTIKQRAGESVSNAVDKISEVSKQSADKIDQLKQTAGEKKESISNMKDEVKSQAQGYAKQVKSQAQGYADEVKNTAIPKAKDTYKKSKESAEQAKDTTVDFIHTAEDFVRSNPFLAVLGAVAVGFVVGKLLSSSNSTDQSADD